MERRAGSTGAGTLNSNGTVTWSAESAAGPADATFNALERLNKQVVMASDSHPKMIKKLKENLVARFVAGMVAKLNPPDHEPRLKIIKA